MLDEEPLRTINDAGLERELGASLADDRSRTVGNLLDKLQQVDFVGTQAGVRFFTPDVFYDYLTPGQ